MSHRPLQAALASAALAFALSPLSAQADDITIGVATAQTGGLAPYDGPVVEGLHLAVEEINAAGGIGGKYHDRAHFEKDVRSDAAQTSIAVQELIDEDVDVLVTPCDADPSFAAAALAGDAQDPGLLDLRLLADPADHGRRLHVRQLPRRQRAGHGLGRMVAPARATRRSLTSSIRRTPSTPPCRSTSPMSSGRWAAMSWPASPPTSMEQQDFSAEVTKIKSHRIRQPDVVMTSAYEPDFPAFIRQLRAAGVDAPR